jgi:acetyl esterase/lipase
MSRSHAVTPTVEETHQIKIVDFQYTTDEMQRINAAAFNDGNCVDDGGRYDWRAGSSITVWVLPDTEANKRENAIKAIFYTHPGAHDPLSTSYHEAIEEAAQHMEFNDNKFCAHSTGLRGKQVTSIG